MTDQKATSLTDALLGLCLGLSFSAVLTCLRAYVLVDVWAMFFAPTWHIATPHMSTAFGISAAYAVVTFGTAEMERQLKEDKDLPYWTSVGRGLLRSIGNSIALLFLWGIAAAVHSTWGH